MLANSEQKSLVKQSFAVLVAGDENVGNVFYNRLFELHPNIKRLFHSDIFTQSTKLTNMLGAIIHSLDDPRSLQKMLRELGKRHISYGIKPADYVVVGQALLETLEIALRDDWSADVEAAWKVVYLDITEHMIST